MTEFFNVMDLDHVLAFQPRFPIVNTENVALDDCAGRVLAEDVRADADLPGFTRATMDGYAVCGKSTFGASDGNPAYLVVRGSVPMGAEPDFTIKPGEAARIPTGGMLPQGADSVIMVEHTEAIDPQTIEVYRSVAPGQHVVAQGEDYRKGSVLLKAGTKIRPQETGLLAAFGKLSVRVYRRPVIGIISTGDEIVPVTTAPAIGQIRDINTYTLAGQVAGVGSQAKQYGIVRDDYDLLLQMCVRALDETDMVLISGGSSVGSRDFTVDVLSALTDTEILTHGISISPGKPTILAQVGSKAFWGLPGHVVSAMIVFNVVVQPFVCHISGLASELQNPRAYPAVLSRSLASVPGRVDCVRVRLTSDENVIWAEPVLGKSGLINTMVKAEGLIRIDKDSEGLDKGTDVSVTLL
jgi:molybdopterin molybdotransferase